MALALAQDAIALLIDMAERGELDPWDVKIVDVIDRFIQELNPFNGSGQELYEENLSQSGQAFLYASMLLLLKADSLTQPEPTADATDLDGDFLIDDFGLDGTVLPPFLERRLRRRAAAQPIQKRRVTLKELIDQIQTIAAALNDPTPRKKRLKRPKPHSRRDALRTIAELAHNENLIEMASALEHFFIDHWTHLSQGQSWIDFDLLLELWSHVNGYHIPHAHHFSPNAHEPAPPQHDRVGVFWALLLLSAQSKVELAQVEFYQDLKINLIAESPLAEPGSLGSEVMESSVSGPPASERSASRPSATGAVTPATPEPD
jgi:segregation and condensation protein A